MSENIIAEESQRARARRSVSWKLMPVFGIAIVAVGFATWQIVPRTIRDGVEADAVAAATRTVRQFQQVRAYYTANVVGKSLNAGMTADFDHKSGAGTIPLPATSEAVQAIQSISRSIEQVNDIAASIASAVEEQGAATKEISRNVQQAASGTQEVNKNIASVTQASGEVGAAATQMNGTASELAKQATMLSSQVDKFIQRVRAA